MACASFLSTLQKLGYDWLWVEGRVGSKWDSGTSVLIGGGACRVKASRPLIGGGVGGGGEMTHLSLVSWPLIGREAHLSGLLSKSQLALWSGRVGH